MAFRFAALLVILFAVPIAAHHSIIATYDSSKVMTLTGKVTEVIWRNPHTSLSMSVTGAEGKVVMWKIEMGGSAVLFKPGFRKEDIFSNSITLQVWPARDGSPTAAGRLLTLPDGRQFDVHDTFAENVPTK
jgi:hypothetical protein